jgi:hypothetical protein
MKHIITFKRRSTNAYEHSGSIKRTICFLAPPDFLKCIIMKKGKCTLLSISMLILFSCKSPTDIKYHEMCLKFFYQKRGCGLAVNCINEMLDKQIDITQGRKYIHKEDENLSPSELDKLNAGITYVQFTPSEKEITDAKVLINKINSVKPLITQTDSICKHAIVFYEGGEKIKRPLIQIVKHPETSYVVMEKDLEEIKNIDNEIRAKLEMSLTGFMIQNNKTIMLHSGKDSAIFFQFFPLLK